MIWLLLLLLAPQLKDSPHPHQTILSWTQGVPPLGACGVSSNKIYRGTASNQETLLNTVPATTGYIDTAVTAGKTYFYQITAVNCDGESARSNEVSATIPHKPSAKDLQPPPHVEGKVVPREKP